MQRMQLVLKDLCQQLPGRNHVCIVVHPRLLAVNTLFPPSGELLVLTVPALLPALSERLSLLPRSCISTRLASENLRSLIQHLKSKGESKKIINFSSFWTGTDWQEKIQGLAKPITP